MSITHRRDDGLIGTEGMALLCGVDEQIIRALPRITETDHSVEVVNMPETLLQGMRRNVERARAAGVPDDLHSIIDWLEQQGPNAA